MSELDKKLHAILRQRLAIHFSNGPDDTWQPMTDDEAIAQIKVVFQEAGYITPEADERRRHVVKEQLDDLMKSVETLEEHLTAPAFFSADGIIRMTGQEFYDRFKAEYHNKADWIAGDPEMGDDAEHDVLLAARLASGITEDSK